MRAAQRPTVVVDTREQRPFHFENAVRKALGAGDYSILGLETRIAVERKRVEELFSCAGARRARFERELVRLARYDYAALVIEGDLPDVLAPSPFSKVSPRTVVSSLVSWSVRYRLSVFFAHDRPHARALTYRLLEKCWRQYGNA